MFEHNDTLLAIAEIAATFAGFAALVTAFARRRVQGDAVGQNNFAPTFSSPYQQTMRQSRVLMQIQHPLQRLFEPGKNVQGALMNLSITARTCFCTSSSATEASTT